VYKHFRREEQVMEMGAKAPRRLLGGVALVAGLLGTAGCGDVNKVADCDDGLRDWEQVTFGVALPEPAPLDLSRLPVSLIEPHYNGPFRMVAQLTRGDFAGVQAYWQSIAAMTDPSEQMRAVVRAHDALAGRGLAVLHQAQAWQAREPDSPAAQLMLAAAFAHAGHEVKGQNWDPKTAFARYSRLVGRMQAAAQWLDPLLDRNDIYGLAARELNLGVRHEQGPVGFDRAWNQYLSLIDFAPHYEWLYLRAVDHARPRHSQGDAPSRLKQLQDLADAKGLAEMHRTTLRQTIDALDHPPDKIPNPQAWRPYWEARIAAAPTVKNLVGWMYAEYAVSNWQGILDITARIFEQHPHHRYAWEYRSWALQQLGRLPESYEATIVALTLGSDWAMNRVVRGFTRGEMGLTLGDHEALLAHCQLGAVMALASAANCLGSSHTDGFAGVEKDNRAALAWHFIGARGGHFNSQHDVAVLLPKVVTAPEWAKDVEHAAGHWLRRASAQDHQAARNKLEARPDWGRVCTPAERFDWRRAIHAIVRSLFS